ncbi:MAG: hypothetical protein KJN66_07030, partial [Bacteroidia bacterium]|nr:hypothetical protein [Bacteroidia bacterium]
MQIKSLLLVLALLFTGTSIQGQILKKLKKKTERAVERKLEQKVEKETEKTMDTILNSDKKKKNDDESNNEKGSNENNKVLVRGPVDQPENENTSNDDMGNAESISTPTNLKPWSKYNFIPGDKIIFHDDLKGEENGEFPSRWDLIKGNAENGIFEGENVINMDYESIVTPLMETDVYLPEVFTIEFDAYFDQEFMSSYVYHQIYKLRFWDGPKSFILPDKKGSYHPVKVYRYGASLDGKISGQPR